MVHSGDLKMGFCRLFLKKSKFVYEKMLIRGEIDTNIL